MTRTCRLLVRGKNVHAETLLATDYLNHFNEVVMLMEMISAMPECLDDLRAWQPKTYAEHFRDSSFTDRDLAVLAYENAPPQYREPFDRTVERLNRVVADGVDHIAAAIGAGKPDLVDHAAQRAAASARALIDVANGIIHGHHDVADQRQIDAMLTGASSLSGGERRLAS
ncbi:MAG: hypothetical protein L6R19_26895 [Alphaproteobacteria bacterium]|nr:hypothetical protein [Alphaproteobacteria bacterium]